jgi:hypothetical protein
MKNKIEPPLSQIPSITAPWIIAVICGLGVFFFVISLQWLIYDDWLHQSVPLRLVGGAAAFVLTFVFVFRWQRAARRRKIETLHRFETIRWMNDRIRNSLQAIECLVYASNPHAVDPVKEAVDRIEEVLEEVLSKAHPQSSSEMVDPEEAGSTRESEG